MESRMARSEAIPERLLLVSEGTATAPAVSAAQDRSNALIAGLVAIRNCSVRVVSSRLLSKSDIFQNTMPRGPDAR